MCIDLCSRRSTATKDGPDIDSGGVAIKNSWEENEWMTTESRLKVQEKV